MHLVGAALPAALTVAVLLAPIATFAFLGVSTVGMTEESTGYRYFYSLRVLYTPDERPWLPQGQIMTLVHMVLQLLITLAGFPVTQLTPRIEIFAILAAGAAHVGTAMAALWALRPIPSLVGRLTAVTLLVLAAFDRSLSSGYYLIVPDYHPWILALGLVALGCTLRVARLEETPSWRWIVGLGLYTGVAISLKVTLVVFAGPPVLLLFTRLRSWRAFVGACTAIGVLAVGLFLVMTWLSYWGDLTATRQYFWLLAAFADNVGAVEPRPFWLWFGERVAGPGASWVVRLAALAPLLLTATALFLRPRLPALVCLPAFTISLTFMWKRDEPSTFIEVFMYSYLALVSWAVLIVEPACRRTLQHVSLPSGPPQLAGRLQPVGSGVAVVALVILCVRAPLPAVEVMLPGLRESSAAQRALDQLVVDPPGSVAVLTTSSESRHLTRDSAIFKGGTNIAESYLWGVSPFVASLVPSRHYFYPTAALAVPIDITRFDYVLFVSQEPPGQLTETRARLRELFGVSLLGLDCPVQAPVPGAIQYGCRRRPDQPIQEEGGEIAFAATMEALEAGGPVRWSHEPARQLRPGEASFVAATSEIWQLEFPGAYVRLRGEPGQTLLVPSIGVWESSEHVPEGMRVTYDGSRWIVTDRMPRSVNRNPTLRMQADGSVRGWDVLTRDHVTVERSRHLVAELSLDGWLELKARSAGARVGVRTGFDLEDLHGGPATAHIAVRQFGKGQVMVSIGTPRADGTVMVRQRFGDEQRIVPARGHWEQLVVRVEPEQLQGDRVAVLIEILNPVPGDRLDIGKVEVFAGRLP